jgi:hypothetical protein
MVVCTAPSGPEQWLNDSFAAVPTFTGDVPLSVAVLTVPDALEPGVDPLVVQVTLTPLLLSTVFDALAVYDPPELTLTLRVVAAIAGAALRPTSAAAEPAMSRRLLARLINVMDRFLDRFRPDT